MRFLCVQMYVSLKTYMLLDLFLGFFSCLFGLSYSTLFAFINIITIIIIIIITLFLSQSERKERVLTWMLWERDFGGELEKGKI